MLQNIPIIMTHISEDTGQINRLYGINTFVVIDYCGFVTVPRTRTPQTPFQRSLSAIQTWPVRTPCPSTPLHTQGHAPDYWFHLPVSYFVTKCCCVFTLCQAICSHCLSGFWLLLFPLLFCPDQIGHCRLLLVWPSLTWLCLFLMFWISLPGFP